MSVSVTFVGSGDSFGSGGRFNTCILVDAPGIGRRDSAGGGPIAGRQPYSPVFGYHWVANFYATRGPRTACLAAAAGAILSTFGYTGVVGPLAADRRPPWMGAGLCGVEHR